jgi:hypothetical protein
MRKRCFIIAALAFAFGVIMLIFAYPSKYDIEVRKTNNMAIAKLNDNKYKAAIYTYSKDLDYVNVNAPNPVMKGSGYVSFGLTGVLLLVGFIVGPEKKND